MKKMDPDNHLNGPTRDSGGDHSLDGDAIELHRAVTDLVRVYQFRDRKRICYHDVSVTQWYTLSALAVLGSPTLKELAEEMYLDKSTTSRVVDSLVRKGYARRVSEPDDGRVVHVEPTPEGLDLHERIEQHLIDQEKKLIADLDPVARKATATVIARLAQAAKERFSRESGICCGPDEEPEWAKNGHQKGGS
jgi:DNA-binding MarR family transcriptional regulator